MDETILKKYVIARMRKGDSVTVTSKGTSMFPVLQENDTLIVQRADDYKIGDVLVYDYKEEGLLVHRLLQIRDGKYFCKGDNSYRLEEVEEEAVCGKVDYVIRNDDRIEMKCPPDLPGESLAVHRLLKTLNNDRDALWKSELYQSYRRKYLEQGEEKKNAAQEK